MAFSDEQGIAMVTAMVIGAVIVVFGIAVSMAVLDATNQSTTRTGRTELQTTADAAIDTYQRGLVRGVISDRNKFGITESAARTLLSEEAPNTQVFRNSNTVQPHLADLDSTGKPKIDPIDSIHEKTGPGPLDTALTQFSPSAAPEENQTITVRIESSDANGSTSSRYTYWQVYRIDLPNQYIIGSDRLVVYFRVWSGDATTANGARIFRAEFRASRFSDYQLLTDSNIVFGAGSTINGPVHSNGTARTPGVNPVGATVKAADTTGLCGGTAKPPISVATGYVSTALTSAGCNVDDGTDSDGDGNHDGTGNHINFLRSTETFRLIRQDCNTSTTDGVACFPARSTPYRVELRRDKVNVFDYPSTGVTTSFQAGRGGKAVALLFDGDVEVSEGKWGGWTQPPLGRMTIAAEKSSGEAANITIMNDIVPQDDKLDVVGLVAQGHVIVYMNDYGTCTVKNIHAAMVAATGGFRIDPKWTQPSELVWAPKCDSGNPLHIVGSIATHQSPILSWNWTGESVGYARRDYDWNPALKSSPPPYFPSTGVWGMENVKEANADCLVQSRRLDSRCK